MHWWDEHHFVKGILSDRRFFQPVLKAAVNDEDIRHLNGLDTPLADGATIMIIPSIAGGTAAVLEHARPTALPELSNDEIGRYSRHLILPEVGKNPAHPDLCNRCAGAVKAAEAV